MSRFECVIPILRVESLESSLDYYLHALSFGIDWRVDEPPAMASVSRSGFAIMLSEGGQGCAGTWVWIGVDDIMPIYNEFKDAGVKIVLEPTNYPWAYEFRIEDPDKHVLRFGSDPRTDTPAAR